jgi:protease-4
MSDFVKKTLVGTLSTLLSLLLVVVVLVGGFLYATSRGPDIEDHSWLVIDLYGDVHEYDTPAGLIGQVTGQSDLTLTAMLDALDKSVLDDRIDGAILHLSSTNNAGWAKLEELRGAVGRVRAAGKPVYAWGDALDLPTLYLASACDSIYMPGGGYMTVQGMSASSMHVRGLLDKLGVVPHLHKIKDYKSATEMIMDTEMSGPAREMRTWMIEEYWDMVVPVTAEGRGMTAQRLEELMEYAEFEPDEAAEVGLIDAVLYWQDLESRLKQDDDDLLRAVSLETYRGVSWEDVGLKAKETVAVVHAQGNIGGRQNRVDPLMGVMMGHESIIAQLRRARLDDDVKAVVFRVDSGGGESLAADLISHEVDLLADVKPVVVSMVDVAASGGYMVSFKATKMMADPLSVTGSIGSINGFFDVSGLRDKLGVNNDHVAKGPMAMLGTDDRAPTAAEWERHADAHWKSFNAWLEDVADRRGMEFSHAETLAHGRIWTGRQAVANGLIDRTGDLRDAVEWAAELAGLDPEEPVAIVHLPESRGLIESMFSDDAPDADVAMALRAAIWTSLRKDANETLRFVERGSANVVRVGR